MTETLATAAGPAATSAPGGVVRVEGDGAGGGRLHLAYIDGLRALAALYVVCVHLLPRAWGQHRPQSPILRAIAKVTSEGHFAVTAFIVISGFCLMLPVVRADMRLRGGAGQFFLRRFLRIAPPMYAAVLLSLALMQLPGILAATGYPPATFRQLAAHALLVQTFVPHGLLPIDGPLWSISVECALYLTFPLIVAASRSIGAAALTTVACVAAGYAMAWALRGTPLAPGNWQYLGAFAIGALAAAAAFGTSAAAARVRERCPAYSIAAGCLGVIAAALAVFGWVAVDRRIVAFDLPLAVGVAAILLGASRPGGNRLGRLLGCRPLAFIGLFSYSLYMTHFPLAEAFCPWLLSHSRLGEAGREVLLAGVVGPSLILFAFGFYWAFERPFHQFSRRVGR